MVPPRRSRRPSGQAFRDRRSGDRKVTPSHHVLRVPTKLNLPTVGNTALRYPHCEGVAVASIRQFRGSPRPGERLVGVKLHDENYRGFASDNYAGAHPEVMAALAE